jgi:hypothetical protein
MRNRLIVVGAQVTILMAVAILVSSCGGVRTRTLGQPGPPVPIATSAVTSPIVIEVFGTQGIPFGGSYGDLGESKTVEGTIPARLAFNSVSAFAVALQKRGKDGELGIRVIVEGSEVKRVSTTKPFGVVVYQHRIVR